MPECRRSEATDLKVVFEQRKWFANLVGHWREIATLEIEARPPGQHAANVQAFALDLGIHVFRPHSLRRALVMRATGAVNVMIPAVESVLHRIDPAF